MRAVEKLGCFKNHLYDMLVAMMNRCNLRVEVEEEDVHGDTGLGSAALQSVLLASEERRQDRKHQYIRVSGNGEHTKEEIYAME